MIGEPGKGVRDVLFIGCPYPGPVGSPLTDRGWGTDDGGDQTLEESRLNTQKRAERGHIGRKERGDGQDVPEGARNPDESRREEKGRDRIITYGTT